MKLNITIEISDTDLNNLAQLIADKVSYPAARQTPDKRSATFPLLPRQTDAEKGRQWADNVTGERKKRRTQEPNLVGDAPTTSKIASPRPITLGKIKPKDIPKGYLSVSDFAQKAGVSYQCVWTKIHSRQVEAKDIKPKHYKRSVWVIPESELGKAEIWKRGSAKNGHDKLYSRLTVAASQIA